MSNVAIRYSYLSQQSKIEINGTEISSYSSLTSVCNRPFSESVPFIIKSLDRELCDEYTIDYYALPFQYNILKSFAKNPEYCKGIHLHTMDTIFAAKDVYVKLTEMCEKYEMQLSIAASTKVYTVDDTLLVPAVSEIEKVDAENAEVGIFRTLDNIPENIRIVVCINDEYAYRRINGKNCFMVPEEGLEDFWDYYFTFEKMIPYISECMTAFKYKKLDETDRIELEVLRTGKPAYYLGTMIVSMDKGEAGVVPFASYPEGAFHLRSTNNLILELSDTTVIGKAAGTASITVINSDNVVMESRTITVIDHLYVQNIRLIQRFDYMKKNERNKIEAIAEPANAEDAEYLEWTSTNPSVAQIDAKGNIIALSEGKTIITCRGKEVNSFVEIEVKPALTGLRITTDKVTLHNGEKQVVEVEAIPANAPTENLRWEIDNRSIASLSVSSVSNLRCQISASSQYTGTGNIRCFDPETRISSVAQLEVKMKQSIPGGGCGGCLIACLVVFLLLMIIGSL